MSERFVQVSESRLRELQDKENLLAGNLRDIERRDGQYMLGGYVVNSPAKWDEIDRDASVGRALRGLPYGFTLSNNDMFVRNRWKCSGLLPDPARVVPEHLPSEGIEAEFEAETIEEACGLARVAFDKALEEYRAARKRLHESRPNAAIEQFAAALGVE